MINFKQAEAFRAVMVTGSVTAAARFLNVSQPAVSRLLRDFKEMTGLQLFERQGVRLRPTNEARLLHEEIERSFCGLENVMVVALELQKQIPVSVRISAISAVSINVMPGIIAHCLKRFRTANFALSTLPTKGVVEAVRTRAADFGVVELPIDQQGLSVERLPPLRLHAVLPIGHPLADRDCLSLRDFADENFISLASHSLSRMKIDVAFSKAGVARTTRLECRSAAAAVRLVASGAGVTFLAQLFTSSVGDGVVLRPLDVEMTAELAVIRREEQDMTKMERYLCDLLVRAFDRESNLGGVLRVG